MIERSFRTSDIPTVDVSNSRGSITIDASADTGRVDVRVDTKHPDRWTVEQSANNIRVRDDVSRWRSELARIHISTPPGTHVDVSSASADVTISVTLGRVAVTTASGDVRVGDAGALSVKSASGDLTVGSVGGNVTAKSASGDLLLDRIAGGFEASTASGDVRVDSVDGTVRVSTASGDVRIGRFGGSELRADTASGDVTVAVPTGSRIDLDVKTITGRVDLPSRRDPADTGARGRRRVELRVKSVSGDFQLNRAD